MKAMGIATALLAAVLVGCGTGKAPVDIEGLLKIELDLPNDGMPWVAVEREYKSSEDLGLTNVHFEAVTIEYSDILNGHIVTIGRPRGDASATQALVERGAERVTSMREVAGWKLLDDGAEIAGCDSVRRGSGVDLPGLVDRKLGMTSCIVSDRKVHVMVWSAGRLAEGIEGEAASDLIVQAVLKELDEE